jgi:hypothetical protein
MLDYLPLYYRDIVEVQEMMNTEQEEINKTKVEMSEVLDQFFIDRATWGLEKWEKAAGIKTNPNLTLTERRGKIKTKLRGVGTITVERLKNTADSFHESLVKEYPSEYRIEIKIVGTRGTPPDLNIMKEALREIVPAHLGVEVLLTYLTFGELRSKTWGEIRTMTWAELETAFF